MKGWENKLKGRRKKRKKWFKKGKIRLGAEEMIRYERK
jgi:hypothetical protein